MGSSFEYLTGVASRTLSVPDNMSVRQIMIVEAPSDAALFEILKNAH